MPIITTLPYNIVNGTIEDATQVMANFNQIVTQVNANAAKNGVNSDITALNSLGNVNSAVSFNAGITAASPGFTGPATNITGTAAGLTAGLATAVAAGVAGQILYQSGAGVTAFAGVGTSGQLLLSAGSSAPVFSSSAPLVTVGNASNLTGASPALGSNWNIDANGQLTNNGSTAYFAVFYNSGGASSGTTVPWSTISQNGSNFSIFATGTIAVAAAGWYEIIVAFPVVNASSGTSGTQSINVSAGTIVTTTVTQDYGTQINYVNLIGYWNAPAGGHVNILSSVSYSGGGLTIAAGRAVMSIRRIG